jgi:hypothetical protein
VDVAGWHGAECVLTNVAVVQLASVIAVASQNGLVLVCMPTFETMK